LAGGNERPVSSQSSIVVGVVVAILIIGAIGTLGYYQFEVAAKQTSTSTSTSTTPTVDCSATPKACVSVNITAGAGTPYSGYAAGSTTLYGYSPASLTIVIGTNNTVVWTNQDSAFHTVTSASGAPASIASGCLNGVGASCTTPSIGTVFQFTFTVPGTYLYHCDYHPWMQGKITVVAGTGTGSASTSSTSSSTASSTTTSSTTTTATTST